LLHAPNRKGLCSVHDSTKQFLTTLKKQRDEKDRDDRSNGVIHVIDKVLLP
jgi:uncharacterized surface protein with fasciclin (FAS1) repeats